MEFSSACKMNQNYLRFPFKKLIHSNHRKINQVTNTFNFQTRKSWMFYKMLINIAKVVNNFPIKFVIIANEIISRSCVSGSWLIKFFLTTNLEIVKWLDKAYIKQHILPQKSSNKKWNSLNFMTDVKWSWISSINTDLTIKC